MQYDEGIKAMNDARDKIQEDAKQEINKMHYNKEGEEIESSEWMIAELQKKENTMKLG